MKKAVLFDLDGTLWDSGESVTASWNIVLRRHGRKEMTLQEVHAQMGKTMAQIGLDLFPDLGAEGSMNLMRECVAEEDEYLKNHGGRIYAGVAETFRALREQGFFVGIVSNCQVGYIETFLEYYGLTELVDDTENYGYTGFGKGHNIGLVVERNALGPVLYIGDTIADYTAAKEAGTLFVHAAYGFGEVPEGTSAIRDIRELPEKAAAILDRDGGNQVK